MIVIDEYTMVNPSQVAIIKKGSVGSMYGVDLLNTDNMEICSKWFNTNAEAELFMDYCCKEIDMANGIYEENYENEDDIC